MSGKKKSQREDFKQEDILQAVIIADSFNVRFAPITQDTPRALIPLVNTPLIDYTLECLCSSGIQQVIIFCKNHSDQIRRHVESSKWNNESSPCEIRILSTEDSISLGDALREIDGHSVIKSDFVLVSGDIVANLNLKHILEKHKNRRLKEKTPIMTVVLKTAPPGHSSRCREEEVFLAVKRANDRILHYQRTGSCKKFDLLLNIFQENQDVDLRYDLLDCHISICSPQVPTLFTDNFDYQTRDDFIRGILVNEEIMGNTIHTHVIEKEYASRVSNLHSYDAVSKDVLNRWSFPLVPDCNITDQNDDKYCLGRHNIYLHQDVSVARGCELTENVVIGKGSCIGSNSVLSNSVIGKNCKIGENVKLDGAYIWDGVHIADSCCIMTSLIADNVELKQNVTLNPGCVVSSGAKLGPGISLHRGALISGKPPPPDEFDENVENSEIDPQLVGSEGVGYLYQPSADSDEELEDVIQDMWGLAIQSDEDYDSSEASESGDDEMPSDSPMPDDTKLFYDEVISTLERALEESIGTDNMVLEINSLKHAYNIQIREVCVLVVKAVMEFPMIGQPGMSASQYLNEFKSLVKKFIPLLRNYIKSQESQGDCLTALEDLSLSNDLFRSVLIKILPMLYNVDILSEDAIMYWHQNISNPEDTENRQRIRKQVQPFIQWLDEAEEESDEEDEDD